MLNNDINGAALVAGDIVFVCEGRFRGCVLTVLAMRGRRFVCRNNSFGVTAKVGDRYESVIETAAVEFYRHGGVA